MDTPCHLCGNDTKDYGNFYCAKCSVASYRAVDSKLNPRWKYSKYIRVRLLEFVDDLPNLEHFTKLDSLDANDRRELRWLRRTFQRLVQVTGGEKKAKDLLVNYHQIYRDYFNADGRDAS